MVGLIVKNQILLSSKISIMQLIELILGAFTDRIIMIKKVGLTIKSIIITRGDPILMRADGSIILAKTIMCISRIGSSKTIIIGTTILLQIDFTNNKVFLHLDAL